jgi:hypothetical protein
MTEAGDASWAELAAAWAALPVIDPRTASNQARRAAAQARRDLRDRAIARARTPQ